ncbi:2-phospho-L-lactate transferase [Bradyrhizobium sp. CSA207]|uniref:2-phospho-L-lactate transferase n=1 Tax=Bradyrhizobium sp. CSA207 TaxID=2698826 RepID=UPI0023B03166|nr:2-phospho-L-lactate transferase [Bradyrhizobium sp. CSA207]MDE5445779.1 2-phospho-L-lactate transferase [Bradyrhizobium sp. CSA207]
MNKSYIALCGGVGGSKLADGLARILPPDRLTIVVNTADDFDHLGLRICPDLDTVTYMLSDLAHPQRGWGRADETWACMEVTKQLGGDSWFQLGDRDLALHLYRTQRIKEGASLSAITSEICRRFGVEHSLVPMCEEVVNTIIDTEIGELSFQDYFVRHQCAITAHRVRYEGLGRAKPSAAFEAALSSPQLAGIIIAPSNPILSIGPIVGLAGVREAIAERRIPVAAVSPLIGGKAVKGPADKLLAELGYEAGNGGLLAYYGGLIDGVIIDSRDEVIGANPGNLTVSGDILMKDAQDRIRVAQLCIDLLSRLT